MTKVTSVLRLLYKTEFKPEFSSSAMDFKVTFKNLNYVPNLN